MIAIKPVSDLRNYNEVLQDVADESPVFLTKNGRGCYAVISIRDYEKLTATKTLFSELKKGENLTFSPNVGISVEKYVSFPTDYKFVLANNYSIFYRIEDEVIRIIRVLYSRRDFVRILFGENSK